MKFILGKKLEMSQVFDEKEGVIPVTLIEAGPCFVIWTKKGSVQIGFEKIKEKKLKKPQKKVPYRYLKEFKKQEAEAGKQDEKEELKTGDKIDVSIFKKGDKVKVSGVSKGKGFAGAVKKWGFHGRDATHGTKHEERTIGSIGSAFPQRVIKGKKMPGRMGAERVTVKNLEIIKIDPEKNILFVKGALPGPRGALLEIKE